MRIRSPFGRPTSACRAVGRRLQEYLDGEIDDDRLRVDIATHLEACRACGLELTTYREVKQSLARERPPVPPAALDRLRRFGEELVAEDGADPSASPEAR